jgi:hypothetical protein
MSAAIVVYIRECTSETCPDRPHCNIKVRASGDRRTTTRLEIDTAARIGAVIASHMQQNERGSTRVESDLTGMIRAVLEPAQGKPQ